MRGSSKTSQLRRIFAPRRTVTNHPPRASKGSTSPTIGKKKKKSVFGNAEFIFLAPQRQHFIVQLGAGRVGETETWLFLIKFAHGGGGGRTERIVICIA
ncbi:hypothetical protein Trydic_g5897 [Trypoxylus dichotomus]